MTGTRSGTTGKVGDWLRGLGLARYEAAFRENEIDFEVLPKLTAEDLKELGVGSVGHRRKLLAAIAELAGLPVAPLAESQPAPSPEAAGAKRRQLTVMICDLVGSTALAARLDPEDMRGVIAAHNRCCAEAIESHGGFVAKYLGDGALAYFGYPEAHEQDPEHAVEAGLAIVRSVPELATPAGSPLHVRVGVATGLVVVGDLMGSGESEERGVVGATPHLAARLQGIAEPDSVVISDGTRRLLGSLYDMKDLGAVELKGIAGPTRAWAVLGPSSVESRFEALRGTKLTAFVGREDESELLLSHWARAKAGEGQVVLLSGEAGVGKSRLASEFLQRVDAEPQRRLRCYCSPQHRDTALYPIIGLIERAAAFRPDDDQKARLDKLETFLARRATSPGDAALFADMLSLRNDGRYPALEMRPPQRRQRMMKALAAQIEARARDKPVLMVVEDAHWADPTTLELLGRLVDDIETLSVLLLVIYRPEMGAPWLGRAGVTEFTLHRLTSREIGAMIDDVVGGERLPAPAREEIIQRADGIPLFAEEMTKAVLEAQGDGGRGQRLRPGPRGPRQPAGLADGAARSPGLPPRMWRRSRPRSGANARTPCWPLSRKRRSPIWRRLWSVSCGPGCCSDKESRPRRPICSSMRSCRTWPMARSCGNGGGPCMPGSPKCWNPTSAKWAKISRSCSRGIARKRVWRRKRRPCGARPDGDP